MIIRILLSLTFQDGDRFWKLPSCYVRGNTIKYLCIPEQVVSLVQEDQQKPRDNKPRGRGGYRGTRGGDARGTHWPYWVTLTATGGRGGRGDSHAERGGRGGGRGGARGGRGDAPRVHSASIFSFYA